MWKKIISIQYNKRWIVDVSYSKNYPFAVLSEDYIIAFGVLGAITLVLVINYLEELYYLYRHHSPLQGRSKAKWLLCVYPVINCVWLHDCITVSCANYCHVPILYTKVIEVEVAANKIVCLLHYRSGLSEKEMTPLLFPFHSLVLPFTYSTKVPNLSQII